MSMKVTLDCFLKEVDEKTTVNNQYPVLTSSKAGIFFQSDYFNKQVASKDNTGYKVIRKGQFTYRAMSDTGEFFPNMLECADIGIVSPAYPVFEITKPDIIIPEYLKYFFKSDVFQYSIASFAQGSTRTSIKFGKLKTVTINLPSMAEQNRIANVLGHLERIIKARKTQLAALDELVKARFVEMFVKRSYPQQTLISLIKNNAGLSYGIVQPGDDGTGDMGVLRPVDLIDGHISTKAIKYINRSIGDGFKKTELTGDELLITVRGTTGVTALTNKRFAGMNVTRGIAVIRYDRQKINPEYLNTFLNSDESQRYIQEHTRGATLQQINLSDLRVQMVIVPPMELQEQFASFVAQIDKTKEIIQKSLEKTQLLFDSLMQEYFG